MSLGTILAGLFSIAQAVPKIDGWIKMFIVAYNAFQRGRLLKENREAIDAALKEYDQRKIEEALGNPFPGKPSHDPGAVIRPAPPSGMPEPPRDNG